MGERRAGEGTTSAPRVLILDPADHVAVAVTELQPGERVEVGEGTLEVRDRIRFGHKLAIRAVPGAGEVIKYREVIGRATRPIAPGEHVHVHNLASARLPGPGDGE